MEISAAFTEAVVLTVPACIVKPPADIVPPFEKPVPEIVID
jgi:hypothetical protein